MGLFESLKKKVEKVLNLLSEKQEDSKDNFIEKKTEKKDFQDEELLELEGLLEDNKNEEVTEDLSENNTDEEVSKELLENEILELSKKSFSELNELYNELRSSNIDISHAIDEMPKILIASLITRGIKQNEATELLKDKYFYKYYKLHFNPYEFRCDDPIFDFLEYFNEYNGTISPIINNPGCYYLLLSLYQEEKISRTELIFRCKNIAAPWILLNKYFWNDEEYFKDNWFGRILSFWLESGKLKENLDGVNNKVLLLVLFGEKFFKDNEFLFKNPKLVSPSQKHEIINDLVENVLTIDNISNLDEKGKEYEYIVNQIRRYNLYIRWGNFYDAMEPIINFIYMYYDYNRFSYLDNSISKDDIESLINEKLISLKNGYFDFIHNLIKEDEMGFDLRKAKLQSVHIIEENNYRLVGSKVREY